PEQILEKLSEFNHTPIHGWDFIDSKKSANFEDWKDRCSFDFRADGPSGMQHTLDLFQDDVTKIVDMRIWFDDFQVYTPDYTPIALQDFVDGGKRAWDSIYKGDNPNTKKFATQTGPIPYVNLDEGTRNRGGGTTHRAHD